MSGDEIDEAIARQAAAQAAADQAAAEDLETNNLLIDSTGRPFIFVAPRDLTIAEIDEICAWMLTALRARQVERALKAGPTLVVARQMPGLPQ